MVALDSIVTMIFAATIALHNDVNYEAWPYETSLSARSKERLRA